MGRAKELRVSPISSQDARRVIKALHYSGRIVFNSQLHYGVFLKGKCGGALQFGPSLYKRQMLSLVEGTQWNEFLELNRMALADWLPRNGESRVIAITMGLLRKNYPHLKWIVSFADASQCGDGAIYRASGFVLTRICPNSQIWRKGETGKIAHRTTYTKGRHSLRSGGSSMGRFKEAGWSPIPGFQLRYIFFLDPSAKDRLTVPIIPYSEIKRRGISMYKGKRVASIDSDTPDHPLGEGGASPTATLQL